MMWNAMKCLYLENVPDQHTNQNLVGQIFQLIPPHLISRSQADVTQIHPFGLQKSMVLMFLTVPKKAIRSRVEGFG